MEEKEHSISKFKLFIENFFIYGLGGVINKIVPLIMVPIVTRLMPDTTYFGISDMSQTIISFGSALAIMGMYDAMYRMFFEKDDEQYKKAVCSNALLMTLVTSFIVFILMLLLKENLAGWFLGDKTLSYVVIISASATLVTATNQIIGAPTRMQNKRKIYLITNTLSPLLSYGIAILLLLNGYYITALPLAGVVSGLTMEIAFYIMNRRWFSFSLFDRRLLKQLLIIAVPLLPNFLIYWVFNSSDRLMITNIINVGAEGVYSVGSKLGQASQLIYMAFSGGWQYFAFSTMKEDDQVESNSKIFEYLGVVSYISTAFICAISYLFFQILFPEQYLAGYIIAPYLFLAPLLHMLFQVACNQFLVIKKTWPIMFILMGGAVLNILLNMILIPILGIEGASIATLIGYVVSVIIAAVVLIRMKLMIISSKFIVITVMMILFFLLWRLLLSDNLIAGLFIAILFSIVCMVVYRDVVIQILKKKRHKEL